MRIVRRRPRSRSSSRRQIARRMLRRVQRRRRARARMAVGRGTRAARRARARGAARDRVCARRRGGGLSRADARWADRYARRDGTIRSGRMKRVAFQLLVSATAAAKPASPLWRAKSACPHGYNATPPLLVVIDGGKLRRIERVTGKVLPATPLRWKSLHIAATHGEIILAVDNKQIAALDALPGKQRWQKAFFV